MTIPAGVDFEEGVKALADYLNAASDYKKALLDAMAGQDVAIAEPDPRDERIAYLEQRIHEQRVEIQRLRR